MKNGGGVFDTFQMRTVITADHKQRLLETIAASEHPAQLRNRAIECGERQILKGQFK